VSPTASGNALLRDLRPAIDQIQRSFSRVRNLNETPSGRIRLIASRTAASTVLLPKIESFHRTHPSIVIDVSISNDPVDLVAGEYDAGLQIGEYIQKDMVAVRVSSDLRLAVVGSPDYFARHKRPKLPTDLKDHSCIGVRLNNGLYRWEFQEGRKVHTVSPQGPVSFDDPELCIQAVLKGVGLGIAIEQTLQPLIQEGQLIQVLDDWCPAFPGFFLYYPSRRNQPAALAALIGALRLPSQFSQ
jgi:DNA-binding transcriptional LysR family regulator